MITTEAAASPAALPSLRDRSAKATTTMSGRPVGSATGSAGGEVEIGGARAIGACQGVGAGRSRGCRLPIRREVMEGILAGPRRPRLTLFVCGETLLPSSAVPFRRSRGAPTSRPSDRWRRGRGRTRRRLKFERLRGGQKRSCSIKKIKKEFVFDPYGFGMTEKFPDS